MKWLGGLLGSIFGDFEFAAEYESTLIRGISNEAGFAVLIPRY